MIAKKLAKIFSGTVALFYSMLALLLTSKETKRAMSAAGAAFLALGLVGDFIFGYLIFKGGGFSSLAVMADGIGLIVSLVVTIAGLYTK